MTAPSLRELIGLDLEPAALAASTLILVDYQRTYTTGPMALDGWEAALDAAADLLARARAAGAPVIHVVNDGGEGSLYDLGAESGAVHPRVAPAEGERIVVKTAPNGFVGTDLGEAVDAAGRKDVVVAGFMTHMCVSFTAEGAFLRGNRVTVVADACATRPLATAAGEVTGGELHRAALATIGDLYGAVAATAASLR